MPVGEGASDSRTSLQPEGWLQSSQDQQAEVKGDALGLGLRSTTKNGQSPEPCCHASAPGTGSTHSLTPSLPESQQKPRLHSPCTGADSFIPELSPGCTAGVWAWCGCHYLASLPSQLSLLIYMAPSRSLH